MKRGIKAAAALVAALALAVSCNDTRIEVSVDGMDSGRLALKQLDGDALVFLDSVTVKDGKFSFSPDIAEGRPRFIYIFADNGKIASMLVSKGDNISVRTDLAGNCSAKGSEETSLLMQVEKDYATFLRDLSSAEPEGQGKVYRDYMRGRFAHIARNSSKLSTLPIFYQTIPGSGSIFRQTVDAIRFHSFLDSLKKYHPSSDYIPAFEKIVELRDKEMSLSVKMENAQELGAPEIILPDINSNYIKLSDVKSKVVMLYFWVAADNRQKMLNNTMMKVVYDKYHDKGLEIYAVSFDEDKSEWARAVVNQKLDWINVNDNRGIGSPYFFTYNLQSIPTLYFLLDGEIQAGTEVNSTEDLDRYLSSLLK